MCVCPTPTPRPTCARPSSAWDRSSPSSDSEASFATTVADVLADGLVRAGTTYAFVLEGDDHSAPLADAIGRRLSLVRVSRPDVACVMAAVSGMLGGAPGAAMIGRDVMAAAPGLAYASFQRAPLIVISSGVPVSGDETTTKASLAVSPESTAHWIAHACQLAMKEPWGPVRLDVPAAAITAAALPVATNCRPAPLPAPDPAALDAAVRLLDAAERPVVVVGRLCRSEADAAWVRPFAEARPAPVLVTPAGRGVVADPHPLVIGTLDAGEAERALLAEADLVVAIGVDPLEVPPGSWPPSRAVVELTPAAVDAPTDDRVVVIGDIGSILEELAPRLRDRRLAEWDVARLHALKQAASAPPLAPVALARYRVVETVRRLTPAGTVAVFEHGEVWAEAARAWRALSAGECLVAREPATEGFAIVAASAAQLACPERRVVCFTEPRALARAPEHLASVAALGVPVLIVVAGSTAAFTIRRSLPAVNTTSTAMFAGRFDAAFRSGTPAVLFLEDQISG